MRNRVVAAGAGLVAVIAATGTAPPPQATKPLRVLSYNIHHGEGVDGKLDLPRIARVIKAADPDLVAVQEVDRNTARTNRTDQAAELGKLTGLHAAFGKAIDLQGGEYGQAILSRFPVRSPVVHKLPGRPEREARVAVAVQVEPGEGRPPLTFVGTHFAHDDPAARAAQAEKANELFAGAEGLVIMAGDLNAVPDSEPVKALAGRWAFATPPGAGLLTIPAETPRRQIDYILFRPAGRFRATGGRVIPEGVASDHRPVAVELEWVGP